MFELSSVEDKLLVQNIIGKSFALYLPFLDINKQFCLLLTTYAQKVVVALKRLTL